MKKNDRPLIGDIVTVKNSRYELKLIIKEIIYSMDGLRLVLIPSKVDN